MSRRRVSLRTLVFRERWRPEGQVEGPRVDGVPGTVSLGSVKTD